MKQNKIFRVGDNVEWESSWTKKKGVIIDVIPAGIQFYNHTLKCFVGKAYERLKKFEKCDKSKLSDGKKEIMILILCWLIIVIYIGREWVNWY